MCRPLLLLLVAWTLAITHAAIDYGKLWRDYKHVPTSCSEPNCDSGGCLYEKCDLPVSCKGGMCFFLSCKDAVCEGGVCVFDRTDKGKCPGGACRFQNHGETLAAGYCTGGACMVEDKVHPANFVDTISM